jgi:BASS family bile acid:Na+ symporter
MSLATLIPLVLKISVVMMVFSLGLDTAVGDLGYFRTKPGLLVRSLISLDIVMPLVAGVMAGAFDLRPPVQIALIALAVSPVPPLLPRKSLKAGGQSPYVLSLLVCAALSAILFIPLVVPIIGKALGEEMHQSAGSIARLALLTVLIPLGAGILVRLLARGVADRAARPLSAVGSTLLLLALVPVLITQGRVILSLIGNGTVAAIAVFVGAGLLTGHLLGGPLAENRTTLALFTGSRHPGIALAIANTNFPSEKLVPPTIVLYLLINVVLSLAYIRWRRAGGRGGVAGQ